MSDISLVVINELETALDNKIAKRTRNRSANRLAMVTDIEDDGTVWVNIPGGARKTPISGTNAQVKKGDVVNILIENNRATIRGNVSDPPRSGSQSSRAERVVVTEVEKIKGQIVEANDLIASNAYIDKIRAQEIKADLTDVRFLMADQATIDDLISRNVTVYGALDAAKADINAANINSAIIRDAWVDTLLVNTDILAREGTVFTLKSVTVDGDLIHANTIAADKIIVRGEDGLYYRLNALNGNLTQEQLSDEQYQSHLDGSNLIANSVTAREINVEQLRALLVQTEQVQVGNSSANNINLDSAMIVFKDNGMETARIANNQMTIDKVVAKTNLDFGDPPSWRFTQRANGNLSLVYIGED